jgi:hypothetical protein
MGTFVYNLLNMAFWFSLCKPQCLPGDRMPAFQTLHL